MSANEHARHGPGREHEWSRQSDATEPETRADRRIMRLFVTIDADDSSLIEIEDTQVTSETPGARRMKSDRHRSVSLSLGEAEWLLGILPIAMQRLRADLDAMRSAVAAGEDP